MTVFLWLMLATLPQNNQRTMPDPTFQGMLETAPIVVIARVDSMWYSMEKRPWFTQEGQDTLRDGIFTNVLAEVTAVYAKSDTLAIPKGSVLIRYEGGIWPNGLVATVIPSPQFIKGEFFVACVRQHPWFRSESLYIYMVTEEWKFTVSNDSIIKNGKAQMSLGEAIQKLSTHFPIKGEK